MTHFFKITVLMALSLLGSAQAQCCAPSPEVRATSAAPNTAGALNPRVQLTYGKTLTLNAYRGQPLVLAVFSTTCPSCITELKVLAQAQRAGVKVLLVSSQDTLPELTRFMQKQRLPFPVGRVPPEFVAGLNILMYPTVLVLDASGRVQERVQGALSAARLRTMLQAAR